MAANEAVSLQLEIRVRKPKNVELTRSLLDAVVRQWANTGSAPRGMKIRIIDWKHPGRRGESSGRSQEALRLSFRGLLQSGRFTVGLRDSRKSG
jgi:hypothetical protein